MRRPVGVKWFLCRSCLSLVSSQPSYQLSPPFHPHSSMSEFFRSVQVGCSRFSRCCHLIVDLFVTRFLSSELPTIAVLPYTVVDERVFSLGASWVFSFQPVLPPDCRPVCHSFLLSRVTNCRHPSIRTLR